MKTKRMTLKDIETVTKVKQINAHKRTVHKTPKGLAYERVSLQNIPQSIEYTKQYEAKNYIINSNEFFDWMSKLEKQGYMDVPSELCLPFEYVNLFIPNDKHLGDYLLILEEQLDKGQVVATAKIEKPLSYEVSLVFPLNFNEEGTKIELDVGGSAIELPRLGHCCHLSDYQEVVTHHLMQILPYNQIEETSKKLMETMDTLISKTAMTIYFFVTLINNKEVIYGESSYSMKGKLKLGKKKNNFKIKNFTHVSTKRYEKEHTSFLGRSINWSHGFWVSGHWRKLKESKLGKDRNGEYKVNGYTWVVPHTRKDELGVVEKTRVIG
jgi:hypothetical protein